MPFHKISTPENQVELRYFTQWPSKNPLIHFISLVSSYTPKKQKTPGFLMVSGGY